jgi:hypothetical protein
MEPALRFIENIGVRLEKLRERLQSVKQDMLQSSISNQTEATRDNTHKLERIQATLKKIQVSTELAERRAWNRQAFYWLAASLGIISFYVFRSYFRF